MKKLLQLAFLLLPLFGMTQVGIGTTSPDASAVLDINSEISTGVRGGLKLPTVADDTERNMIDLTGNPVGLMIYNQNSRCVEMYDAVNMNWVDIQCLPALPQTSVEFASTTTTVNEDDTQTITLNLTNPSAINTTTVEVNLQGGSTFGTLGTDYDIDYDGSSVTSFPFTVTFPTGVTSQDITIFYFADNGDAIDETGTLELQNPSGGNSGAAILGTDTTNVVTFNDDDLQTTVQFATTNTTVNEDNAQTININITNPSTTNTTTVQVDLQGGSTFGTLGADYDVEYAGSNIVSFPFTVTFPANTNTSQDLIIYYYDDVDAIDETGTIELQNASGGTSAILGTNTTNSITFDDDEVPAGPVVLGTQNFETTPATPNLPFTELDNGSFQTGSGPVPNTDHFVSGSRGYGVSNNSLEIDFASVDASSYTDATLTFKLAAFGSSTNGLDTGDYVDVYISTDGGTTFSYELEILGNSNARWDFSASGTASITYDGDNVRTTQQVPSGGTISNGIAMVTIDGIPNSSNLVVSIIALNNNSNERWVIDDVVITGN